METIFEYSKRSKTGTGKDPHYSKAVTDPFRLSKEEIQQFTIFLPFFCRQIDYLRYRYTELSLEAQNLRNSFKIHKNDKMTSVEARDWKKQEEYFKTFDKA